MAMINEVTVLKSNLFHTVATNMDTENALGNNSTPMSETPESESPPSPSSTGPGGFSAEAIIGIIVGILISLVLAVAVVVVVVCLAKRRQTAKSYSTGKDVPLQGLGN